MSITKSFAWNAFAYPYFLPLNHLARPTPFAVVPLTHLLRLATARLARPIEPRPVNAILRTQAPLLLVPSGGQLAQLHLRDVLRLALDSNALAQGDEEGAFVVRDIALPCGGLERKVCAYGRPDF